ncbi:hypothetical protein [uncultured Kordia sp.]|uniref:hypothetical protein n=1 Tax=uncultured Kordia sp. TaxID=507699 RepID=UPI0026100027|nr:hypothetical protein [uncultured Kordia sp.]
MSSSSTFLLESKLKRLKISFSKENGKIIIGKSKVDYMVLFGFIILPIIIGIAAIIFINITTFEIALRAENKVIGVSVALLIVGVINIFRMLSKKKANQNKKILEDNVIKIIEDEQVQRFEASNISDFEYATKQLEDESFEAKLFLVDTKHQKHLILGFDGENEQYVLDDVFWFIDYFKKHLGLQTT